MRLRMWFCTMTLVLATSALVCGKPMSGQAQKAAATMHSDPSEKDGAKVFQQQCARCHNAPEGFSPRISGTILRHMRVRASLSKEDEAALMRFFNP